MGKVKNKTIEEKLLQKRERERKRREKIKNDPIAYSKAKLKEHERYLRRKEEKKIKSISNLSARDQRQTRKRWRIATAKYREKKKNSNKKNVRTRATSEEHIDDPLELSSSSWLTQNNLNVSTSTGFSESPQSTSSRVQAGRKRIRRDRSSLYRKLTKIQAELNVERTRSERYKKKYYRLLNAKQTSPKKAVKQILKNKRNVPNDIRIKLLENEVLKSQLKNSYNSCKTDKAKQLFTKAIGGKILKKYKMLNSCKYFLPYKRYQKNLNRESFFRYERKQRSTLSIRIQKSVRNFLEADVNSTQCPGKKDTITLNKQKRIKRKLNDNLINLHKKYVSETNIKIGYSTFCRLKPFYIVHPKVNKRDTCLCTKHENFRLMFVKLHQLGIIKHKDLSQLYNEVCCNPLTKSCFIRECSNCSSKQLTFEHFGEYEMSDDISYYQWSTIKKSVFIKSIKKIVQVTEKEKKCSTVGKLIKDFKESVPKLLKHEGNHRHQYEVLTNLKNNISEDAVVFHVDFSENYSCKLNAEPQSFHFGASRKQVTLHTGMIYCKTVDKHVKQGFCTISGSLRHDPCSIWAHLKPIFNHIVKLNHQVKYIHFISDSPTNQYRNKVNFYLFHKEIVKYFPALQSATWNYTEAGHGKGAPDGIGSAVKQIADKAVAQGIDIPDEETLFEILKQRCHDILIAKVSEGDITEIENDVPQNINRLVGTMKVHQISWAKSKPSNINARSLSCFNCKTNDICNHYHITSHSFQNVQLVDKLVASPSKNSNATSNTQDNIIIGTSAIQSNSWVAVVFEKEWYPGEVVDISDQEVNVNFMARAGKQNIHHFKWPTKKDCLKIPVTNIVSKLSPPYPISSRHFAFAESAEIDNMLKNE